MKTWLDFVREDLRGIPFMESHGFTVEFSSKDKLYERTTPKFVPHDPVSFKRENIYVWKNYKWITHDDPNKSGFYLYWVVAELINNHFCHHKQFDTLIDIINEIDKKPTILDGISSFEYDKNRNNIFGIKSGIVWGHSNKSNSSFPMLYISKPKGISKEDFDLLLDKLEININNKIN